MSNSNPLECIEALYKATRQLNADANVHDALRNCREVAVAAIVKASNDVAALQGQINAKPQVADVVTETPPAS